MKEFVEVWYVVGWGMMAVSAIVTLALTLISVDHQSQLGERDWVVMYRWQRGLFMLLLLGGAITFITWSILFGGL